MLLKYRNKIDCNPKYKNQNVIFVIYIYIYIHTMEFSSNMVSSKIINHLNNWWLAWWKYILMCNACWVTSGGNVAHRCTIINSDSMIFYGHGPHGYPNNLVMWFFINVCDILNTCKSDEKQNILDQGCTFHFIKVQNYDIWCK